MVFSRVNGLTRGFDLVTGFIEHIKRKCITSHAMSSQFALASPVLCFSANIRAGWRQTHNELNC
jgi:hypothetical protein